MTSTERIRAMMDKKPVDRCGVSGWLHMPMVDRNVKDYTKATIDFTLNNGWDFTKLMSNGHYMADAYGAKIRWRNDPAEWSGEFLQNALTNPEDCAKLQPLDPATNPVLQREIQAAKGVATYFKGEVPLVATIFSPLTWVQEMYSSCNPPPTVKLFREHKKEVQAAMEALTETNLRFLDAMIDAGIDGIFYATQFAVSHLITKEEHDELCRPYDLKILNHIKDRTWFNMLHVHGDKNMMFQEFYDYPVQAINWENCTGGVDAKLLTSIREVRKNTDKILIGGIDQHNDYKNADNDREAIKEVLRRRLVTSLEEAGGPGQFIFAPGCALPLNVDRYVFTLMMEVVQEEGLAR